MCLTPIYIKKGYYIGDNGEPVPHYEQYPCGKCLECIKQKQLETAVLSMEEAKKYDTIHFVTLTYNDDTVPIARVTEYVDLDTGDVETDYKPTLEKKSNGKYGLKKRDVKFVDQCRVKIIRSQVLKNAKKGKSCYVVERNIPCSNRLAFDTYYLSLRRKDVSSSIKRFRQEYVRKTGKNLDFSYYGAGEYGSQTYRPHYHFLFFGLTQEQVDWLCHRWNEEFGFTGCIEISKADTESQIRISNYVAKYITKAPCAFEDEKGFVNRLESRYVEQCRKFGSLNFGISQDFEKIKESIIGDADLNVYDQEVAKKIIEKRSKYHINGKFYRIPKKIKDKIYKQRSAEKFLASPLRKAIIDVMESRHFDDCCRQLEQITTSAEHQGISLADACKIMQEKEKADRENKYRVAKDNLLKSYAKSKIK